MSAPHLIEKSRRNLPHWKLEGSIYWINFRLADSLPQDKLRDWKERRDIWKQQHPEPWSEQDWREYNEQFGDKLEAWLDAGMGSRALARPDVREAVRECLLKFDGDRLVIHAAVIMPTHVHALIEPLPGQDISELMKGIKGASARSANQLLGTTGTFWLDESYDHIVRSQKQYEHFCRYIEENPVKARLKPGEYWLKNSM
jgi:REP element-mobilizing transposase RayT